MTAGGGATVADGFPIPYDTLVSNNMTGATFATGTVTLTRPGTYLVNWWVTMQNIEKAGAESGFAVEINGVKLSGSYAPFGTGQIAGSSLVTVHSSPSTLQLVNHSGEPVTLSDTTAQSGITVTQFA